MGIWVWVRVRRNPFRAVHVIPYTSLRGTADILARSAVYRPIANSGAVVQRASRVYNIVLLITIIINIVYFAYFINRILHCTVFEKLGLATVRLH